MKSPQLRNWMPTGPSKQGVSPKLKQARPATTPAATGGNSVCNQPAALPRQAPEGGAMDNIRSPASPVNRYHALGMKPWFTQSLAAVSPAL
jgi:hypothetical protein